MRANRPLVIAWLVTLAMVGAAFVVNPMFAVLAQFLAFVLSIVTVRRTERTGVLKLTWLYRAALGLLLAATATVLVAAGSTAMFEDKSVAGFVVLATTNLLATILCWRAIVNPAPRRAALAGLFAVCVEMIAMILDVVINIHAHAGILEGDTIAITLLGSFVATWLGAVVCVASLLAFEPVPLFDVPDARVVDDA